MYIADFLLILLTLMYFFLIVLNELLHIFLIYYVNCPLSLFLPLECNKFHEGKKSSSVLFTVVYAALDT